MSDTPTLKSPVPLSKTHHKGLKIKRSGSAAHLEGNHFAKLQAQEFPKVAVDTPIIFIKDPDGNFLATSMWGFEENENLFVEDGNWTGGYFPAIARCFPFAISPDPEKPDHFYIGLFENSEYQNTDDGELLINEDGSETEAMKEMKDFLARVHLNNQITKGFVKKIDDLGLIVQQTLQIQTADGNKDINGIFIIDKEKFNSLPDDIFLELRKEGVLDVIYAQMLSLETMDNLTKRRQAREIKKKEDK